MLDSTVSRVLVLSVLALMPYMGECRHFRPVWHHKRGGEGLEVEGGYYYPYEVEERKRHFETPEEDEGLDEEEMEIAREIEDKLERAEQKEEEEQEGEEEGGMRKRYWDDDKEEEGDEELDPEEAEEEEEDEEAEGDENENEGMEEVFKRWLSGKLMKNDRSMRKRSHRLRTLV